VDKVVIEPLDHKHLNVEVPDFKDLNPSVENIAKVIFHRLAEPIATSETTLESVTVWETSKTWCQYRPAPI
jgi:6-pyruvoyltetrahydropterin/6-carboxytetrahydropterin synthase